jgi:hypothetical protein
MQSERNTLIITICIYLGCMLSPLKQQAQIFFQNRNITAVWGADDYRPSLFPLGTSSEMSPFKVIIGWNFDFNAINETDSSAFFRYLAIGVDTVKSHINYNYRDRTEEIGRNILDILELHRRQMLELFLELQKEFGGNTEAANTVAALLVGGLQLSLGMPPTFGAPIPDDEPPWIIAIEEILESCERTLDLYNQKLIESNQNRLISFNSLKSFRDSVRSAIQFRPSGVTRTFSKHFYGFSIGLGAISNAMTGSLESPPSFKAIRPLISLDLYVNRWQLHGAFYGISFDKQNDIQMGDVVLRDYRRNLAVMGHVSLAYAFTINDRWRFLPEISRMGISFREEFEDSEVKTKFYDVNDWGWGLRFQHVLSYKKEYGIRTKTAESIGMEYYFRHHLYSIEEVGRGSIFTFGVNFYVGINVHRKLKVIYE